MISSLAAIGVAVMWMIIGAPSEKIILNHADTLRSRGSSRELIGHVKVTRLGTTITSQTAVYSPDAGRIVLTGSVKLVDSLRSMTAERIEYDERSGDYIAGGGVVIVARDSVEINCRSLRYRDETGIAELFDDLVFHIFEDSSSITGHYGSFKSADSSGFVEGGVVYMLPDAEVDSSTGKRDTTIITSERLNFSRSQNYAIFSGDVKMTRGELLAVSDSLYHYPNQSMTRLAGAPLIWRDDDELSGKVIQVFYEGRKLKRILAQGDGMALSKAHEDDKRKNRLAGETLELSILELDKRTVSATGDALGWYFVFDPKKGYQGVNIAAANIIRLNLEGNKTTDIMLEGKTSGTFYPPGMEPPEVTGDDIPKRDGIGWGEL
jgi:lipopolysaccharide export system protein LptA